MNLPNRPVLVVEDVPHILELLEITLRFKGYAVLTARDGKEALEVAEKQQPALVITDILMPHMDGFALVQSLRTNPKFSQVPIIFLSATYITPEDRTFAMQLGAARFLEKPIDTDSFLLTVEEVLNGDPAKAPPPPGDGAFYKGYRERLESKLRHKKTQIARTERMLETLSEEQKPSFQALLVETISQRDAIQHELDELYHLKERQH